WRGDASEHASVRLIGRRQVAWWFAAPALVVIGVFFVLPVVAALAMSLTDFVISARADISSLRVVGVRNYVDLLERPLFWKALGNTLYFVAAGGPPSLRAAPGAGLLLGSEVAR